MNQMIVIASGKLNKLVTEVAVPVNYYLPLGEQRIFLNPWVGRSICLEFLQEIFCIQCDRKIKKSFQQGYCYPCYRRLAECGFCIIHPERCHMQYHICSEHDWVHAQCNQKHIVYLANSSGLKVGITREKYYPTRWMDQGARQALPLFYTANRYQSGLIEVCLKQFVNDRTDWRKLLRQATDPLDLIANRNELLERAESELAKVVLQYKPDEIQLIHNPQVTVFDYPIQQYSAHLQVLSFDKTSSISGKLQGIKGQYLMLDTGVLNIRKFSGYQVRLLALENN